MNNYVPEGWSASNLGELCIFSGGSAFKEKYQGNNYGDYPFIKVSDMNLEGNQRFITKSMNWINEKVKTEAKIKIFPASSVVFAKVGAALLLNRRRILVRDTAIDNNMMSATPYNEDNYFLFYLLQNVDLGEIVQSGAVPSVNQSQMEDIPVLIPPLPEQKKIAAILTSVDTVIEKTQAQIDKLKDLKTGMMQELLTKGIGHTEFKDSPVGWIPVEWEVDSIESFGISILDGDRGKEYPKEKDFFQNEYCLFLSAKNVTKHGFKFNETVYITKKKDDLLRKGKLIRNDIVITTRGTVGNIALYDDSISYNHIRINSGMAIIRNQEDKLDTEYLNLVLHSPLVCEQIELLAFGSAQPQLTIGLIKNLFIPKPDIEEQNKISKSIGSIQEKISIVESKLKSLQNTKKALMQDLLTGKVRLKV